MFIRRPRKRIKPWIISPLLMGVLLMIVYFLRGIYPFGINNISYYDMSQTYIPSYIGTWDALRNGSIFWNWNIGGGTPGGIGLLYTPITIFLMFVSRNNMLAMVSYLLLINVMLATFSMSFFADKKYKTLSDGWKIIFGIMYGSSAYMLLFYTNIQFLIYVIIFPLLIYSVDELLAKKKSVLFILLFAYGLGNNVQMMFMVCLYLVVYFYFFSKKKKDKKRIILHLAISTIISMLASAVYTVPGSISMMQTSRASESATVLNGNLLFMLARYYDGEKLFTLYGTELIIAITIVVILKKKVSFKSISYELYLCFLTIIPIIIECINIAWHIGGYAQFPMRFAYMLTFSMLLLFGNILQQGIINSNENSNSIPVNNILALLVGIFGILQMVYFIVPINQFGSAGFKQFNIFWIPFSLMIIVCVIQVLLKPKHYIFYIYIVCQCVVGWSVLIAPSQKEHVQEFATSYIDNDISLLLAVNDMATDEGNIIARVRDESASIGTNYPDVLGASGVSSSYYSHNGNMARLKRYLGHSTYDYVMMDTGGTLFSDALFHIRKIISLSSNSNEIYELDRVVGKYVLKNNTIYYPYGVLVSDNIREWSCSSDDLSIYQNSFISAIHCEDLELFSNINAFVYAEELNTKISDGYYKSVFELPIEGRKLLYFGPDYSGTQYQIRVNGEIVLVPELGDTTNSIYPRDYNCGYLFLGLFDKDIATIEVESDRPIDTNFILSTLDINLLKEKTQEQHQYEREITPTNNGLKYKVNNTDGYPYLLLPIGFQDKFWCKVNGKFVECEPCVEDALTLIPIEEGMNEISLVYIPRGLITGAIISVIGLIALIIMWKRWDAILEIKWLQNVANVCFTLLFWAIIVCIYIIPTIAEVVLRFIWNPFGI